MNTEQGQEQGHDVTRGGVGVRGRGAGGVGGGRDKAK